MTMLLTAGSGWVFSFHNKDIVLALQGEATAVEAGEVLKKKKKRGKPRSGGERRRKAQDAAPHIYM